MKLYFLLRNNTESGPYTHKDLKEIGLASTDLIWVDSESTSWAHPTEIAGLNSIAETGIVKPLSKAQSSTKSKLSHSISSSSDEDIAADIVSGQTYATIAEEIYPQADKESFSWQNRRPRINAAAVANSLFGLGVLMVGIMLFAFVMKKLVDHFEYEPNIASSEAVEISTEKLPTSTTAQAAMGASPIQTTQAEVQVATQEEPSVINAITTTVKSDKQPLTETLKIVEDRSTENLATNQEPVIQAEVKEEKKQEESETKPVVKAAPTLSISANDYKVGMFGGVSDLEITVNNPSALNVDRAIVEVEFLKPNGNVVKTQLMTVENIGAGTAKKISVPASSRGVKIRYRVVSTDVHDGKIVSNDI